MFFATEWQLFIQQNNQSNTHPFERKKSEKKDFFLFMINLQSTNCWQFISKRKQNNELFFLCNKFILTLTFNQSTSTYQFENKRRFRKIKSQLKNWKIELFMFEKSIWIIFLFIFISLFFIPVFAYSLVATVEGVILSQCDIAKFDWEFFFSLLIQFYDRIFDVRESH